jgi:glycosyltransferase involved in cell wall biosynthesis
MNLFRKILSLIPNDRLPIFITIAYIFIFRTHERPLICRRIRHSYYLKNWVECKRNRELLRRIRENLKDDLNDEPLISVLIPTYNRGKILAEQTIPTVLRQTYQKFEIIIVGDHCTDNTEELVRNIDDERIKFYNLPKRGQYPENPNYRWLVAGVVPCNKGLELASGEWIAHLDDDDEFSEDHLEVLLNHALKYNYEMVYGITQMEIKPGKWVNVGLYPPECGHICHLSVLYHSKLKFFKYDINAWKYGEPADWNLWRRMKEAGVKIGFVNNVVGRHYKERAQISR